MTKITELEDRIARMEKILIDKFIMPDPNAINETQYPRVEKEKTVDPIPISTIIEEDNQIETQYPRKE